MVTPEHHIAEGVGAISFSSRKFISQLQLTWKSFNRMHGRNEAFGQDYVKQDCLCYIYKNKQDI